MANGNDEVDEKLHTESSSSIGGETFNKLLLGPGYLRQDFM
jgi:hypothetical protein